MGATGMEFSTDNTKLYATAVDVANISYLYQLDLSNNARITTLFTVPSTYLHRLGAVARGSDGRIYVAQDNTPALSVIASPYAAGVACRFQAQAIRATVAGRREYLAKSACPTSPTTTMATEWQ